MDKRVVGTQMAITKISNGKNDSTVSKYNISKSFPTKAGICFSASQARAFDKICHCACQVSNFKNTVNKYGCRKGKVRGEETESICRGIQPIDGS